MHERRLFAYLCEFYRSIVIQCPCVRRVCVRSRFHVYFRVCVSSDIQIFGWNSKRQRNANSIHYIFTKQNPFIGLDKHG